MNTPQPDNPGLCPICGGPNDCQPCSATVAKGPCWCANVEIPAALLARVPEYLRNRACICRPCVMKFHGAKTDAVAAPKILSGDFYFTGSLMVFTAAYHLRRGYCCGSGCQHCPYPNPELKATPTLA